MILSLIYQGIVIILLLSFSFGPSFFALINTGIKYGYKTGSLLAMGIIISDFVLCMMICAFVYLGAENILQSDKAQKFSAILGGIILIVFGAFYFKKHVTIADESIDMGQSLPGPTLMIVKGFLLNFFNPTVWLLWLANVTAVSKTMDYSIVKMVVFFSIVLGTVLCIEFSKVYLAGKIKKYLTDKLMTAVNYITGTILVIVGVVLIYNHFFSK